MRCHVHDDVGRELDRLDRVGRGHRFELLRDQCAAAGVAFHFKQWGEWAPYDRSRSDGATLATPNALDEPMQRLGKKAAGRQLDGRTHDESPTS